MKLILRSDTPHGLMPSAYRYMDQFQTPPAKGGRAYRPILGIYNLSISRCLDALAQVIEGLIEIQALKMPPDPAQGTEWIDSVVDLHSECLLAMESHLDDCSAIAEAAFSSDGEIRARQSKRFKSMTKGYDDRIGRIVNHLKHHHGRLRGFVFHSSRECFPGYYVEGVAEDGSVGPEPTVHKGGKGAFSFARDVRLHFVWIYFLSERLAEILAARTEPCTRTVSHPTDEKFLSVARRMELISSSFFPDEAHGSTPVVKVIEAADGSVELLLRYSTDEMPRRVRRGPGLRILQNWRSDGVTRNWRLPYPWMDGPDNVAVISPPKR